MKDLPQRKNIRLKDYDYSLNGAYFITICIKDRHELLGKIYGWCNDRVAPIIELSEYGIIVKKYIENINSVYNSILVDKYAVMPNHIHLLIFLHNGQIGISRSDEVIAPYKTSIPTVIRSFKTFVSKECGFSIWQASYHDHIIRNEEDYRNHWRYIDENSARWTEDEYYMGRQNASV